MSRDDAWQAACASDPIADYNNLLKIWPVYHEALRDRIWTLKHPGLKKWTPRLGWITWSVIALFFAIVVLSVVHR